jgi:hypothetical protein
MTLTHIDFAVVQRSKFRNGAPGCAVKTAAYLMCGPLEKDDGTEYDFSRKRAELVRAEILLPDDAPERFRDPKVLWNACENIERRADSQTARQVLLTIPRECPDNLRVDMARAVAERWRAAGMGVQFAVHNPASSADKEEQPHVHYQLTMRAVEATESGLSPRKRMDWNTQFFGPSRGRDERQRICDDANTFLARRDLQIRLDPRTLAEQGIDRPPEPDAPRAVWESWKREGAEPAAAPEPVARVLRHRNLRKQLAETAAEQAKISEAITRHERAMSLALRDAKLAAPTARKPQKEETKTMPSKPTKKPAPKQENKPRPQPWMTQLGGVDALSEIHRNSAQESYDAWVAGEPEKRSAFAFASYVSYVQDKVAERAEATPETPSADTVAPRSEDAKLTERVSYVHKLLSERYAVPDELLEIVKRLDIDKATGEAVLTLKSGGRIIDTGDFLRTIDGQITEDISAATVATAHARGWTSLTVTGSDEYRLAIARAAALHEPPISTDVELPAAIQREIQEALVARAKAALKDGGNSVALGGNSVAPAGQPNFTAAQTQAIKALDRQQARQKAELAGEPRAPLDAEASAAPRIAEADKRLETATQAAQEARKAATDHGREFPRMRRLLDAGARTRHGALQAEADRLEKAAEKLRSGQQGALDRIKKEARTEARAAQSAHDSWRYQSPVRRATQNLAVIQRMRAAVSAGDTAIIADINGGRLNEATAKLPQFERAQVQKARAKRTPEQVRGQAIDAAMEAIKAAARKPESKHAAEEAMRAAVGSDPATIAALDAGRVDEALRAAAAWRRKLDDEAERIRKAKEEKEALKRRNAPSAPTVAQP